MLHQGRNKWLTVPNSFKISYWPTFWGQFYHAFWHTQRFQVGLANNNQNHGKIHFCIFCNHLVWTNIYIYIYKYISHMIWSWKLPGPLEPRSWCHGFPRALWQTKKSPGKPQSFLTNTIPNAWFPMAIGQFIGKKKLRELRGPPSVSQPIGGRRLIRYSPGHTCCCWKRDITAAYLQNESFSSRNRQSSSMLLKYTKKCLKPSHLASQCTTDLERQTKNWSSCPEHSISMFGGSVALRPAACAISDFLRLIW